MPLVSFVTILAWALPAHAELLFFTSGRNMSIKAHRVDGDAVIVTLRSGGEMILEPAAVDRITPDEVPYPEPEQAAPVADGLEQVIAVPYGEIIDRVSKSRASTPSSCAP